MDSITFSLMRIEFRQADADVRVVETTYLRIAFIASPNGSPTIGSNAPPCICHVLRPNKSASDSAIAWKKCSPMASCQYGRVHPPCLKPPSVSSTSPPGAWITPSKVMNSATISSLIFIPFLHLGVILSQVFEYSLNGN